MKSFKALLCVTVLAATAAAPFVRAESASKPSASVPSENLTPAQKSKIDALMKEEHKAIKAIKDDAKLKEDEKAAKTKALKKEYKEKIAAVTAGK
jgi:hypothetical protein